MPGAEPNVVEVVLFIEYSLAPAARPERFEHFVQGFTEREIDLAEHMGLGTALLFPHAHGTAVALALGARIDTALAAWRPNRATPTYLSLLSRLRALSRACRERPRDQVMARTV